MSDIVIEATRVERAPEGRLSRTALRKQATYHVLAEKAVKVERRVSDRRKTRLQSGKILDKHDRFITEFLFENRTADGARLKLAQHVEIPRDFLLFDDANATLHFARVAWRRGAEIGCRVHSVPVAGKERVVRRLQKQRYAVV